MPVIVKQCAIVHSSVCHGSVCHSSQCAIAYFGVWGQGFIRRAMGDVSPPQLVSLVNCPKMVCLDYFSTRLKITGLCFVGWENFKAQSWGGGALSICHTDWQQSRVFPLPPWKCQGSNTEPTGCKAGALPHQLGIRSKEGYRGVNPC